MLKPGEIKIRLSVDLVISPNGTPLARLKDMLESIASEAAGHGGFTGESPAEVEEWTAYTEVLAEGVAK